MTASVIYNGTLYLFLREKTLGKVEHTGIDLRLALGRHNQEGMVVAYLGQAFEGDLAAHVLHSAFIGFPSKNGILARGAPTKYARPYCRNMLISSGFFLR